MESDSDGEPLEADYSSMKQPPLIKQLRGILSEYPDGGQIIKELLQNAEDAGASEVSLLYESRRINRDNVKGKPYRKFFQGPALCLYNDAVFTEQDWEGIQMIYSSVKEDDRQKVGRFGLGFKSVFHITDYPCVISGDRVLCVDPQQSSDKVNASMKLSKLTRYKKFDYEAFMIALDGTFNIDRNISSHGNFTGTIFWFPLREVVSPISETLYNEEKVMSLFNVFKNEAENILIFLRSLTSISLNVKESDKSIQEIAKVKLAENIEEVTEKRLKFKSDISQLQNDYIGKDIQTTYTMTIQTFLKDKDSSTKRWMIVNMFIGESASLQFRALIQDPSNGNSPYVGVAVPLLQGSDHREQLEGHVYCILPLPKEGAMRTGLPVHINGFFALNQSRHHLKWQTDEQADIAITDKDILWNRCLIEQAIPLAYTILVERLIDHAIELRNPSEAVTAVYNAIPNIENATAKWKSLVQAVLTTLVKNTQFLYFNDGSTTSSESWITVKEATFATFRHHVVKMLNIKEAVIKTLLLIDLKFVDVPSRLFDSINRILAIEDLSPRHLGHFLQQRQQYKLLNDKHKLAILEYLMADNDYNKLSGLELIPLASGSWTTFQNNADDVHVCSADDLGLFPGLEASFIRDDRKLTAVLIKHFQEIGRKELFQVRQFHVESFKVLVRKTVHLHMSRKETRLISNSTPLTYKWLTKVWKFMLENDVLQCFNDVALVPQLKRGTWSNDSIEVELHCINDTVMVQQYNDRYLPEQVAEAIKCLNVVILQCLPDWFPKSVIKTSMFVPTSTSIAKLFAVIYNGKEGVKKVANFFNSNCGLKARKELVKHICSDTRYDNDAKELLKTLDIFRQVESTNSKPDFVCLKKTKNYINRDLFLQFPNRYPYAVLSASKQEQELLQTLGASRIDMPQFLVDVVARIQNGTYSQSEVHSFMKYVFENFKQFEKYSEVLDELHQIKFLKTNSGYGKVSDLFSPFDEFIKQLFYGENRFPTQSFFNDVTHRHILERLGLKCIKDVTATDLLEVAKSLEQLSSSGTASNSAIKTKANSFLEILDKRPDMLDNICRHKYTLSECIYTLECIPVKENRESVFPKCLPWYNHSHKLYKPCDVGNVKFCLLAGSTIPMLKPPTNLQSAFRWDELPAVCLVLNQLVVVKNEYIVNYKTEMLTTIKAIYRIFSENECDVFFQHKNEITSRMYADKLLWNGDGFCGPTQVIIRSGSQDLDLRPHFYLCPDEFRGAFEKLYIELGCRADQGVDILLQTLENLRIKHKMEHNEIQESIVKADISLADKILNRLAARLKELNGKCGKILIPVQTIDDSSKYCRLRMKSIDECVYDKENLFLSDETEDDAIQYFVHSDISCDTAKALGVKSVNLKALSEAEGFEEWGQVETITARISSLLERGYVDGLSVLKELMQNADDAGASTIKFLYDERQNDDAKHKLLSSGMRDCQGPSLWVYNNATFSKADLVNITKLNGATKQNDCKKIGKFGLGFCSVYNLTDVPSFITGNDIVMFDPHMTYLQDVLPGKSPGLRIDLTKASHRALLRRHSDQFKPYEGIFGCSLLNSDGVALRGSLFRLPLRTFKQSQNNKISSKIYSKEEIVELLRMFISSAGNMFLFTQNVETLEIYHLPSEAKSTTDQSLLFSVKQDCFRIDGNRLSAFEGNVMEMADRYFQSGQAVEMIQRRNIELSTTENARSIIHGIDDVQMQLVSSWIIAWSSENICPEQFSQNTTIPLSAIAIPCGQTSEFIPEKIEDLKTGFYKCGHVFCFLPLPVPTHLPVHINGYFDVADDRRQLRSLSEDDKASIQFEWNKYLMKGSLVHSFILLLKTLALEAPSSYVFHSLWPNYIEVDDMTYQFTVQFYKTIVNEDFSLFKAKTTWISFKDAIFLDTKIQSDRSIGKIALEMLQAFIVRDGKSLVDLPVDTFLAMRKASESQNIVMDAVITEKEMLTVALRNMEHEFWNDKYYERNTLIIRALQSKSSSLFEIMCNIKCIPVEPSNTLRRPNDIVNPYSDLAQMFTMEDGRNLSKDKRFRDRKIINKLLDLGMINRSLPEHCLIERCYSVQSIAEQCCQCAYERSYYILRYLNDHNIQQRTQVDIKNEIQTIDMLPVLPRPTSWKFQWQSDTSMSIKRISKMFAGKCDCHPHVTKETIVLAKPIILYRQYMADFVGTIENVVDESEFKDLVFFKHNETNVFTFLGVKCITQNESYIETLIEQILAISNRYNDKDEQFSEVSRLHQKIFNQFKSCIQFDSTSSCINCLAVLQSENVVLIGNKLLCPRNVVYELKEDCFPDLVRLPRAEQLHRKSVYDAIGVRTSFPVSDIIQVLHIKKKKWKDTACDEIEVVGNLLVNLKSSMEFERLSYSELRDESDGIVCPDEKGILRPTSDLVIDDDNYKTRSTMHILHESIPPQLASALGVKPKHKKSLQCLRRRLHFGQREKLVTRLKKILSSYPCDSAIMKELLQNADDAGATEIHFITDYRTHNADLNFGNEKLQGPSLYVFNDSYFKESDFEGIHNLGEGSKGDDPTKTGQYGVGFNAVYHLTDTPSFLTKGPGLEHGGTFCIFDPLCCYLEDIDEQEPGMLCDVDGLVEDFPNVLNGYTDFNNLFKAETGTLFRFPLRCGVSKLSKNEIANTKMGEILDEFKNEMFEALLFLKHVNCIKISDVETGKLCLKYEVKTSISEKDMLARDHFFKTVEFVSNKNIRNKQANLEHPQIHAMYRMKIEDSQSTCKEFYLVQQFGFGNHCIKTILNSIEKGLIGQLPIGGVALPLTTFDVKETEENMMHTSGNIKPFPLNHSQSDNKIGKAFCFLPLPVYTGLPIHVNGHFSLDYESRRDLSKETVQQKWNKNLLKYIITPAYVSVLNFIQHTYIDTEIANVTSWSAVNKLMAKYHSAFPTWNSEKDMFWKYVVRYFYKFCLKQVQRVFPVVQRVSPSNTPGCFRLTWTAISYITEPYQGVFNVVDKFLFSKSDWVSEDFRWHRQQAGLLSDVLKRIGMKLISSPKSILETLKEAKLAHVQTSTPTFVIKFLKTFCDNRIDGCRIVDINRHLTNTLYENVESLNSVARYVMLDWNDQNSVDGLPILLTADGKLRVCSSNTAVYNSTYWSLFQNSKSKFVHESQIYIFDRKVFYDMNLLKPFGIIQALEMLPTSIDSGLLGNDTRVRWNKEQETPLSSEWIRLLFQFIYRNSLQTAPSTNVDHEKFQNNVRLFQAWSIMPSTERSNDQNTHYLIPVSKLFRIYYRNYEQNAEIISIIDMFNLPLLDVCVFDTTIEITRRVKYALQKMISSTSRPLELLECFIYYRNRISESHITIIDSVKILSYFGRNVKAMAKTNGDTLIHKLAQLPLFPSQQGTLVSIENIEAVLVLPNGMPDEGIEHFASSSGIVLLQQLDKLDEIYNFMGLERYYTIDLYTNIILPAMQRLPNRFWIKHIKYIRDYLLQKTVAYNEKQRQLLSVLKTVAFVNINGVMKRVNELYSPNNEVFKIMLAENDFPPQRFQTQSWKALFEGIGLILEPSGNMMIKFATEVQDSARQGRDRTIDEMSDVLVKHIFLKIWSPHILKSLNTIKFVVPYRINKLQLSIYKQVNNGERLVCFMNAVSSKYAHLCWSSIDLIPEKIGGYFLESDTETLKCLGVLKSPPLKDVLAHCQNICERISEQLTNKKFNDLMFLKRLMTNIYAFLEANISEGDLMKRRLECTPIIYLPSECKMVEANKIVLHLSIYQELKPYLYRAPSFFGQFEITFVKIGSHETLSCHLYTQVLKCLKNKIGDNTMMPIELDIVKLALRNFVQLMLQDNKSAQTIQHMFLPNRERKLIDSKNLVVSNNSYIERRVGSEISLNYFLGFQQLELTSREFYDTRAFFKQLPQHVKPVFLTDIVKEKVCLEESEMIQSKTAKLVEDILHSNGLIEGVIRIVKHCGMTCARALDKYYLEKVVSCFQNLEVVCVTDLKTVLHYQENSIHGSERTKECYIAKKTVNGISTFRLYLCAHFQNNFNIAKLANADDGLIVLIQMCSENRITDARYVSCLLMATPCEMKNELDKLGLVAYDCSIGQLSSVFPKPGTYVEEIFHPFLEQGISRFIPDEYKRVALQLEDDMLEVSAVDKDDRTDGARANINKEPLYIYVHIIRPIESEESCTVLQQRYLVDTGDKSTSIYFETVPIYRLYRFVRTVEDAGTDLVKHDEEPINPLMFDENCRRIRNTLREAWTLTEREKRRIFIRLLLKWHPHRNKGNEEYTTRVFNYLQEVNLRLERSEHIDDSVDNNTGRRCPDVSGSRYYGMNCNLNSRATVYARAYYNNINQYNTSNRTGNYVHVSAATLIRPDPGEAKRWLRQAKCDYQSAVVTISEVKAVRGQNWICYICHQASEKALKAAVLSKDGNSKLRKGHSLSTIARAIRNDQIHAQAVLLESLVGEHTRMRYPDSASRPSIPSELFSTDDAKEALEITKNIIDLVDEYME